MSAGSSQDGISPSCCIEPSTVIVGRPSWWTLTLYGASFGGPLRKRWRGLIRIEAKLAVPGSAVSAGGVIVKLSFRSGSAAVSRALMRTLPRLSRASWARACELPFAVRGISSAVVSLNGPTSTTPSSTSEARASSRDLTRTAKGMALARTLDDFGGLNLTRATASAPGKSGTTAGSTSAHADASPSTSSVN